MKTRLLIGFLLGITFLTGACSPEPVGPWHPERTDYPRLLYTAADIDAIAARLDRYPYDALYARVLGRASRTPNLTPGPPYDASQAYVNANIAKACAFVYAIEGDPVHLTKAVEILAAIDTNFEPMTYELTQDEIHIAEALQGYCQAADMLLGTGTLPDADRLVIAERLSTFTETFFLLWGSTFCMGYEIAGKSNHHTKMAAAIGTAAILLNQHPMARIWIDFAMHGVTDDLDIVTTAQGGYNEGPYYLGYSAVNVLPFAWAYRTFTGGVGEYFTARPCEWGTLAQEGEAVYVPDLFTDPTIRSLSDWRIKIRQPDGSLPPIDDSNLSGYYNGMVAGVFDDGVYAWDWLEAPAKPLHSEHCTDMSVDLIVAFDDTLPATEPEWGPTLFLPEAGQSVLRSDWGLDATYVLFMTEYGKARNAGHDQPDGLSFILYAHGETLAMDSGYIRWEDRDLVRFGKNHNLVLVDGAGPPSPGVIVEGGVDAYLTDGMTTSFLDYAAGWTTHNETTHARALIFPRKGWLLVADDLRGWYDSHDYQWLLHGNGGGSTGGTFGLQADGGLWEIDGVSLRAAVTTVGAAPALRTYDDYHGFQYGRADTHAVLEATGTGQNVRFLAALVPVDSGEPMPEVEVHADLGGVAAAVVVEPDRIGAAFMRPASGIGALWSLAGVAGHPELPAVSSDAGLLYVSVEPGVPGIGALRECFGQGLTRLEADGIALATLDGPASLAVRFGADPVEGNLLAAGPRTLDLLTGGVPTEVSGPAVTGFTDLGGGVTRIHFAGSSDFLVHP